MECKVHWVPATGMGFVAETGSGHLLTMDGAPEGGGRNLGPRPMEALLAGGRLSIERVAELSGFKSAGDFRRVWQRHEAGAPGELRRRTAAAR